MKEEKTFLEPGRLQAMPRGRRVLDMRCVGALHLGTEVHAHWPLGRKGQTEVHAMEMIPAGVLISYSTPAAKRAQALVPYANIHILGLEAEG